MAANPDPLYHQEPEEPEVPTDGLRFFKALLIAAPIATLLWAGLFYLARWIWHLVWAVWTVYA